EQVIGKVPTFELVVVSGYESDQVSRMNPTVGVDGQGPDVRRGIEGVFVFQFLPVETLSVVALVTVEILGLAGVEFEGCGEPGEIIDALRRQWGRGDAEEAGVVGENRIWL
ncbi:MAG: hypothetical protein ACRDTT_20505, partial [Pseudonocardiaceae bacterium]